MQDPSGTPNRPTIRDIAEIANVSTTTVHRALTGNGPVSEAKLALIRSVASELGYQPNRLARSLQNGRSSTIGVVTAQLATSYDAQLLAGVVVAARELGYDVLIQTSATDAETERHMVELLLSRAAEGIIIQAAGIAVDRRYLAGVAARGVPLITAGFQIPELAADCVSEWTWAAGWLAGRHLRRLGRGSVAIVAPPRRTRTDGCACALSESGGSEPVMLDMGVLGVVSHEQAANEAVRRFIGSGGALDGLYAFSDSAAQGAISALLDAGLRVPEDVSVVGHGDESFSAHVAPRLSTVCGDPTAVGRMAARMLVGRCTGDNAASEPVTELLKPSLVIRESCGAHARDVSPSAVTLPDGWRWPCRTGLDGRRLCHRKVGDEWVWEDVVSDRGDESGELVPSR